MITGSSTSVLAIFFDILELLPILFFLEFEILLGIVHPILFVDFLEHAAFLLISCDVKVHFLFSLRHWWNNIFETLFVRLIVWINLQLFSSLEIVITVAMLATILTQSLLWVTSGTGDDISLFLLGSSGCSIGFIISSCSGILEINKWWVFSLLCHRFDLEHFFTLLVAGNTIFHINGLCLVVRSFVDLINTRTVAKNTFLSLCDGFLTNSFLSRLVSILILIFSLSNLMHLTGFISSLIVSGLHPLLGQNLCSVLFHGLHKDHSTCDLGWINNTSCNIGIRQFVKNWFVSLLSKALHFFKLLDIMVLTFLL